MAARSAALDYLHIKGVRVSAAFGRFNASSFK